MTATRAAPRCPTHPGELMREILDDHVVIPIAEAARRMRIPRPSLCAVLNGTRSVTADMALRFGKLTGGDPGLYVQMQAKHDLWQARRRLASVLPTIRRVT